MKCELIGFISQAFSSGENYSSKNQLGLVGEVIVLEGREVNRYGDFRLPVSEEFFNSIAGNLLPNTRPKLKITVETIE